MTRRLPDEAPPRSQTRVVPGPAELAEAGAREFVDAAREAVADRGRFCVALAGGSTPRAMYERLTGPPFAREVRWSRVLFFWGDERCVSQRHPRSNYSMARKALLEPLAIPSSQVFRMRGELEPGRAAQLYRSGDPVSRSDPSGSGGGRPHRLALSGNQGARRRPPLGGLQLGPEAP